MPGTTGMTTKFAAPQLPQSPNNGLGVRAMDSPGSYRTGGARRHIIGADDDQFLARSPSRLAATVSLAKVSPEPAISLTDMRTRSTSAGRAAAQASTAAAPAAPFPAMAAA